MFVIFNHTNGFCIIDRRDWNGNGFQNIPFVSTWYTCGEMLDLPRMPLENGFRNSMISILEITLMQRMPSEGLITFMPLTRLRERDQGVRRLLPGRYLCPRPQEEEELS